MQSIPATEARANFADLLRRVSVAKERIVIERRGRPAVAMVPVEDLEAVVDAAGRPVEHVGTVQDITELERAQEALRESEQRLDFITENSNVPIFISRISDGTFKYFNTAAAEIFGMSVEELAGRSTREFYHDPSDRRLILKELEEKGAVRNFELKVKRADGSTVWVLDSVTRTKFQGEEALLSTIVDITERKQAEETLKRAHDELERRVEERTRELHASNRALEEEIAERERAEIEAERSRALLADAIEALDEGFVIFDNDDRMVLCNSKYRDIYHPVGETWSEGTAMADIAADVARHCVGLHSEEEIKAWVRGRMAQRHNREQATEQALKDGRWIRVGDYPLANGWTVGTRADITELKQREVALHQQRNLAQLLQRIASAANESTEVAEALQTCLDEVCAYTGWPVGHAYMLADDGSGELVSTGLWHMESAERFGAFRQITEETRFEPGIGLPGRVLKSGQPAWIADVTGDTTFLRAAMASDIGLRAGMAFPALLGDEVAAVLEFFADEPAERDESILKVMANIGMQLGRVIERRQAEEALRESEERFRQMAENFREVFWMTDPEKNQILYVSPAYEEIWGRTRESLYRTPLSFVEAIHPEDRERVTAAFAQQAAGAYDEEYRILRPDGETRWIRDRAFPVHDETGAVYRVTGIAEDITERRRADESLRRLAAAIEGISEIVTLYDTDDRLVLFNQAFCDINRAVKDNILLGMSFEELMRTLIAGGMVPEAAGREEAWLQERLERHRNPPGPFEVARQDGICLLTNEQRLRDGGNITISLDITERKRADEALRESERRLANITENMLGAIYRRVMHADGTISYPYMSSGFHRMFDFDPEKVQTDSQHMFDTIHPDDIDRALEAIRVSAETMGTYDCEYRMVGEGGGIKWCRSIAKPRRAENGDIVWDGLAVDITERKRAEDALRVSEGQVRLLMNSTAEAIYGIDLEGNCSFANPACAGMLGYDRAEDLLGKHMHDLIHHTRHDGTRYPAEECLIYQAFARGEGTHVENEVLWRRDGTSFPAEYWSHPVRRDGEVVAVVVTFLDITERRQAEVALQESEARLSSFINNIPNAIYLKDTEGRYVLVNASAMKQYGLPKNRLIGKTVYDIHSKGEADATVKQDREVLKQGIPIEAERELTYPDGSKHTIIAVKFPVRGESGEINSIGGINIDITERKRAEAALRESDARLRDAIESISEGFILYDADDRLVLCNSKYRDFYPSIADILKPGAKLEDLARTAFETGAVQGSAENVEAWMKMRLKQHRTGQGTHEQHLADGRWVLCSERKTSGGGTVGIRTDITERRRAEEQLRQAQKLEAVGQLTGGIAHDFNNLLTIIIGNLDMLDDHLGDDPPAKNFAQSALKATFRGAELTQQLLAFSRKQTLAPKLTDANGLVSSMTELMRRSLAENIEIETVLAGGIWKTVVDRGQLENALLNLAINARDAMPKGGKLTLKTANRHLDADDPDTPAEAATGPYVVISVSDTGTGMTPEVIEHVFEPFFTTKGVGEGSGLGLSMVYGFIKQSGGHIAIHSEVGRGTTVALYLPKAAALDEGEAAAERKPKALPRGEETVLVVEDDPDVRAFVTNALAGLGYDVLEADDGPSVLSLLDDLPDIDLLVSDVVLPGGMNGLQIAEAIRRLRPRIKVLFTSGYAQSAIVHHGQLDEGVELLAKPFTREALARRVREVLDAAGEG